MAESRVCRVCGIEKPLTTEYFNKDREYLTHMCKVCRKEYMHDLRNTDEYRKNHREYAKEWRRENPDKAKEIVDRWKKKNPDLVRKWRNDWNAKNPEPARKRASEWYYKNRDYALQYRRENGKKYREENKLYYRINCINRRAKIKEVGGSHTKEEIISLLNDQGGKCKYCGCDISNKFHIDHFVPISKGGSNSIENLVLSCPTCNLSKGDKYFEDWILTRRVNTTP